MDNDSVSCWIVEATAGDELAAKQIVDRYYQRLVHLARRKLGAVPPQVADEEGAVISAFRSFFSGIEADQFHQLEGRDDLWKILATITIRKSIAQIRRHWKQRGEAGRVDRTAEVTEYLDRSLTPEQITVFVEECERRIASLEDPMLRQVVVLRLEGYDTREIASKLEVHQRTVQRKLSLIESIWLEEDSTA